MTYDGVTHEFFGMGTVVPQAQEAVDMAVANLREAFGNENNSVDEAAMESDAASTDGTEAMPVEGEMDDAADNVEAEPAEEDATTTAN